MEGDLQKSKLIIRAINALRRNGIFTISEAKSKTYKQLKRLKGIGVILANIIIEGLKDEV